ncbi:uncharacterized protein MONOS_13364 [Monocercomonoides exilis]|uniref:uncharacterized protein n=1 Tax=Monocercomonoides exilis TaxID=2049356 RepID=UPI00355A4AD0|nr:hypothetical protein MONOS_13364 [Monocercomonoides exilis]|eukprot:MONOS_13364.1-p1 / transcript=MONOS_13364.1 / gene=MONOS_13364 / organism=Monocercomonoides_exilis_PA203 / gene_product=unspecified product / transcript_product=unspecified product / location=Mono_scaffold00816:23015-25757(+) / protein_length=721 / sequence_SO=supercontig / SO=protein_coding / is_pseudo=false
MLSKVYINNSTNEMMFKRSVAMVEIDGDMMSSSSSDEYCDLVDVKNMPIEIWKQILKKCDTKTKMRLMGTSKFFRKILDTDEYWHEIVVEELPRLRDNIYMSQDEFQNLDTYDPNNADDVADKTRFGLSSKGWKDTIRLYGTFPEVLFGKRKSLWRDVHDLKSTIEHPWMSFILFTLTWISLMLFLFFFFFAIFYATNFIRGPVFDRLADDEHVSNLLTNKVTRSVFSFSLSRSKGQFTVALVTLTLFFFFFTLYLVKRKKFCISFGMNTAPLVCLIVIFVFLCKNLDNFVNGDAHTFNIRNRLVDGPVTKPYPQRSIKVSGAGYDVLFRKATATEAVTQKFTEDGRLMTSAETILLSLLLNFFAFFGGMLAGLVEYNSWLRLPERMSLTFITFFLTMSGLISTWVLFSLKMCYNITSSWTITFIPLFLTIIPIHILAFNMKLSKVYDFETICSKSMRCCGIVFGSAIGIVIVLIPSLCLDGIGKFDPPTSSGEAWEGAERFMSAVVVTDELIERAHKMERNMMLSLVPMLVWLFVEYVMFCVGLYLVKGDVKWIKRRVDLKKGLFVWQALAPSKRSREMQEIRADERRKKKKEKEEAERVELEKKEKEEAKAKAKEMREKEKDQRLIDVTQRELNVEELSAAIDEINKYYDEEDRKEAEEVEAEEAEKKRAEEEAKKKKEEEENAKENENQSIFDEPPTNPDIHELWEKILRKCSFSWLV